MNADFGIKSKGLGFRILDSVQGEREKGKEKRQIKNNTRQTTPFFFDLVFLAERVGEIQV